MGTVDILLWGLLSEKKKDRLRAAELLGQLGDPKAVRPLLGIVHNSYEDIDVRIAAIQSVAKIGDLNAVPELLNAYGVCTKKLEKPILLAIGQILGRTFPDDDNSREVYSDALNTLIRFVQDDASYLPLRVKYDVRDRAEAAAEALRRTGDPKAIPVLTTALEGYPDEYVRKAARESLQRFIFTHPDAVLRISPDDRHRLGRLIQDAQRDEILQEVCK
jgi:HEAT repeat protein